MNWLVRIAEILFVLAVPLVIICASVTWAINDRELYQRGFETYNISLRTGISELGLLQVGSEIRKYFNSSEELLQIRTEVFGVERDLFNPREVAHMRDVKVLVRRVGWTMQAAGAYIIASIIGATILFRSSAANRLVRLFLWGGLLTVGVVGGVGILAATGFEGLFLKFHEISFSNDLWQLDPRTDYLIMLFPQGFWFDATMQVALTSLAAGFMTVVISGMLLLVLWWFGPDRSYWRRPEEPELLLLEDEEPNQYNDPWRQ